MKKRLKRQGRELFVSEQVPEPVRGIPSTVEGETTFPEVRGEETGQVKRELSLEVVGKEVERVFAQVSTAQSMKEIVIV